MTVERIELAQGLSLSRVLTGLWQIADMERDGRSIDLDAAADAMVPYVEAGLTTFDMADHYGSAEEIVGRFVARHGEGAVEVATKWVPKPGPLTREAVRSAVEHSLDRLRSNRIDLLQFHAWSWADPSYLDGLFWLRELRDEGLIGHLGVTNFDAVHLEMILESGVEAIADQLSFSLIDQRAAGRLTEVCSRQPVELLAYGTLTGGLLTDRWLGASEPKAHEMPTWSLAKYKRFIDAGGGGSAYQEVLGTIADVARRLGVSTAQVAMRHILDQPAVGAIIVGARLGESEHIVATRELFELEIDAESRSRIDAAVRAMRPVPGDCGDEYRRAPFLTASGDLSHHLDELPPPFPVEHNGGDYDEGKRDEGERDRTGRRRAASGTAWEELAGYSRAVRDAESWESVARAHGERFAGIRPANTLVEARLVGDGYLVEIEAEALVAD